jgi:hypothetical protein
VLGNAKDSFQDSFPINLNEAMRRKGSVKRSKMVICDSPAQTVSSSSIRWREWGESLDNVGSSRLLAGGVVDVATWIFACDGVLLC